MSADAHRFRFFVEAHGAADATVALTAEDSAHVSVLRLQPGAPIEIVDGEGVVWAAVVADAGEDGVRAVLDAEIATDQLPRGIELLAGALVGSRFDELVDGAVQAGVASIRPLVRTSKDRERLAQRRERLQRLATAAAKQSKQARLATVHAPIDLAAVVDTVPPGIVLDAHAEETLGTIDLGAGRDVQLLVGPADGLNAAELAQLRAAGWRAARIGPSILRAELAAPVAVAIVAMRLSESAR